VTRTCRLYPITPPTLDPETFAPRLAEALDAGDVACVQLRLPGVAPDRLRQAAAALLPICRARDVALVIDEALTVAAESGADGVHLGDEGRVAEARRALGPEAIVGVACGGSRHRAMRAAEAGADYVSFGAFFPSPTLPEAAIVDPDILTWWQELMEVPCVAVGGLTPETAAAMAVAGADFVAASAAIWTHPEGPAAAVEAFNRAVERALANC